MKASVGSVKPRLTMQGMWFAIIALGNAGGLVSVGLMEGVNLVIKPVVGVSSLLHITAVKIGSFVPRLVMGIVGIEGLRLCALVAIPLSKRMSTVKSIVRGYAGMKLERAHHGIANTVVRFGGPRRVVSSFVRIGVLYNGVYRNDADALSVVKRWGELNANIVRFGAWVELIGNDTRGQAIPIGAADGGTLHQITVPIGT